MYSIGRKILSYRALSFLSTPNLRSSALFNPQSPSSSVPQQIIKYLFFLIIDVKARVENYAC